MAHFAQLDDDNIVINVVVVNNQDTMDENGIENEEIGIRFLQSLLGENTKWRQTSYNNNFRKKYAGLGYSYNESLDAFIAPKPFESWMLDEESCIWVPPYPQPPVIQEQIEQGYIYQWDEELYQKEKNGWILKNIIQLLDKADQTVLE